VPKIKVAKGERELPGDLAKMIRRHGLLSAIEGG